MPGHFQDVDANAPNYKAGISAAALRSAPRFEPVELIAPSYWASYLLNGDSSGIDSEDVTACDSWIKRQGMGAPVSCSEESFFSWNHSAFLEMPLGSDCLEYVFLIKTESDHAAR